MDLVGRIVVVSPHLDDGVLSLGASIARSVRRGSDVTVLTVLAGDPESRAPAGRWDRMAGFGTAGVAARARRAEDRRACDLLGARPVWLPFSDHQYVRDFDDERVWSTLLDAVRQPEVVLVPAFPLMHEDHAWVAGLFAGRPFPEARTAFYVEQPYAALWTAGVPSGESEGSPGRWAPAKAAARDRLAKARSCRAYSSQIPLFDKGALRRMARFEARRGGELVSWAEAASGEPGS